MALQKATLPNGMQVSCINSFSVADVHRQVQQYFRHGITVRPGDTVFDVGGNIGLFSLLVYEKCGGNVTVYSFEPIPAIFEALRENLSNLDARQLKPFNCGLSNEARIATFAYRPNMPTVSSLYGNDDGEMQDQLKSALLKNLAATPLNLRWLRLLPSFARNFLMGKAMRTAFEAVDVECQLRRLSDVVREEHVERIDLLKVDVDKSEFDVLEGIDDADWARIQQVVMEIHDLDNRLDKITTLLKKHGITNITVEQEEVLQGSNVYALYASRPKE